MGSTSIQKRWDREIRRSSTDALTRAHNLLQKQWILCNDKVVTYIGIALRVVKWLVRVVVELVRLVELRVIGNLILLVDYRVLIYYYKIGYRAWL